ncbi:hypothetical protein GDO86_013375 [Hymenochirus boettgeri]|uniref:Uncharacterized protein n=1 Tax=Hymenochirus boettgeri TaxID=247094 RepID=A0A8T2IZ37_9PIPI|nr:hypothetical protein GDO86_013375 [Hymenochirus boettgeri]
MCVYIYIYIYINKISLFISWLSNVHKLPRELRFICDYYNKGANNVQNSVGRTSVYYFGVTPLCPLSSELLLISTQHILRLGTKEGTICPG